MIDLIRHAVLVNYFTCHNHALGVKENNGYRSDLGIVMSVRSINLV